MTALSSKSPVMFSFSASPGTGSITDSTTVTTVTTAAAAAAVRGALHLVNIPRFMDLSSPAAPPSLSCLGPELIQLIFKQRFGVASIPYELGQFSSVFRDSHVDIDKMWPSTLLDPKRRGAQKARLYVSELPLCDYEAPIEDAYQRAIPSSMLVSLKLVHPSTPLVTNLKPLKNLLLKSSRLETLQYEDRGQGTQFVFQSPNERMPALIDLSLTSYDWQHSAEDVKQHWDFSRLRTLGLISVPIFNFLSTVSFQDLRDVRELRVDDWSSHMPDRRLEATQMLSQLIGNHIYALDTLEITCHIKHFDLQSLQGHSKSLQRLKLRDHVGFRDEDRTCPSLQTSDVCALAKTLPFLRSLEIDLDIVNCPSEPFLEAVSQFSRLQTLTLHVQTVVCPMDYSPEGVDLDAKEAMRMVLNLIRSRAERDPTRPWKQIIINVGGWQPVMVRRLGPTWRMLNEQGITAERHFVASRNGNRYEVVDASTPECHVCLGKLA
ncbi:unnamed protein product [Clonostachys rhizophaga]|uniref:F-box domain-containing protein n=1 Tax=Clonostachys rhizophaga TaxID=160324 RepID=A0A9N9VFF8_9HYPO|nr:unnamed protein product [Clonostachys rhizophaga]